MFIKVFNIDYDLHDPETNPNNEITPEDFELPSEFIIDQNFIDRYYGDDFNAESDIEEAITCHTGFSAVKYEYEVLSEQPISTKIEKPTNKKQTKQIKHMNNDTTTISTTDEVNNTPTVNITVETVEAKTSSPAFDRAAFIAQYNQGGSPKQRKVPCSATGEMVTIFGANLKRRIEKYGSVEAFLDGFVSRKAASKKYKEKAN